MVISVRARSEGDSPKFHASGVDVLDATGRSNGHGVTVLTRHSLVAAAARCPDEILGVIVQ